MGLDLSKFNSFTFMYLFHHKCFLIFLLIFLPMIVDAQNNIPDAMAKSHTDAYVSGIKTLREFLTLPNLGSNKEHIKEYYINNIDHIKEYKCTKFNCICGGCYTRCHKSHHVKSLKHINYITKHDDIIEKVNDLIISINNEQFNIITI